MTAASRARSAGPVRAYEQIRATLRASVIDGRLAPGTVLLEGPLSQIFGSSRSPVKHALEQLRAEGLVSRFDGRGLVVGNGRAPHRRVPLEPGLFTPALPTEGVEVQRVWGWQRVANDVERALVRGCVLGRFRVNEVELAHHYGIGRTVAHDVLVRMEASGIVGKTERAHWVTVSLDDRRVRHLYALRALLETAALEEAAFQIPPGEIAAMRARLAAAAASYPAVAPAALDRLEHDLHVACLRHAANLELLAALRRTRCIIISSKHLLGTSEALSADDPFLAEHDAVLAALAAGKPGVARGALERHLRSAQRKVLARLRQFRAGAQRAHLPFIIPIRDAPLCQADARDRHRSLPEDTDR